MTDDETTGPGDASDDTKPVGQPPAPQVQSASNEPEAVILEERVIKAAEPNVRPPAPAPAPDGETNFAHILESIKLPERRDFKASADTKPAKPPEEPLQEENASVAGAAPAVPAAEPDEPVSSIVTPLRTLKDDLQTVVREQKISLVHAASLEEEKKHGQEHLAPEQEEIRARKSRRVIGIVFAACILILLGAGALYGVYFVMQEQQAAPSVPQSSILFAEQTVAFPLGSGSAQDLKASLAQARTEQLGSLGSITRIVPTVMSTSTNGQSQEVPATLSQFFSALGMNPPQELMSAIGPDFFFGFHVVDTNAPLLVIPVTSYDNAFAGMLAWEPTMDSDLAPIFTSVSMTIATSGVPVERTFQDAVMRNYDVRELLDDSGNVVLYYSFPTPNLLVIAQSPYSFTEILSRLQAEREL